MSEERVAAQAAAENEAAAEKSERSEARASKPRPRRRQRRCEQDLDELTAAQRERDEYLELAQRTRADFDNYRKRVAGDERGGRRARQGRACPRADPRARQPRAGRRGRRGRPGGGAVEARARARARRSRPGTRWPTASPWSSASCGTTLERAGVESYDPAGEPFDPAWHEALSTRAAAQDTKPGTVLETLERGYRLDGQVLRPARVVVSE